MDTIKTNILLRLSNYDRLEEIENFLQSKGYKRQIMSSVNTNMILVDRRGFYMKYKSIDPLEKFENYIDCLFNVDLFFALTNIDYTDTISKNQYFYSFETEKVFLFTEDLEPSILYTSTLPFGLYRIARSRRATPIEIYNYFMNKNDK